MGEFITEYTRVARKPHRCWECHQTIEPGERYCRTAYRVGSSARAWAAHLECAAAAKVIGGLRDYQANGNGRPLIYADVEPDELAEYPIVLRRLGLSPGER
jgi:hypothetical protein